jgi:hypothetical protein
MDGRSASVASKKAVSGQQGIFNGVHFYILRALRVIQRNWRATKLRFRQAGEKGG